MNNLLFIETPREIPYMHLFKKMLKRNGFEGKILVQQWNEMLKGNGCGIRLAKMCIENDINIVFIHLSPFSAAEARNIVQTLKSRANVKVVLITSVTPEETFGADDNLNKPIDHVKWSDLAWGRI